MITHYTANSHKELTELIETLRWEFMGDTLAFRGQKDASWKITSGLSRMSGFATSSDRKAFEQQQIADFLATNKDPIRQAPPDQFRQDWDQLIQLQHLGCATRLIDWSMDDTMATYFATEDPEVDGALFTIPALSNVCLDDELKYFDLYNLPKPMMVLTAMSGTLGKQYPGIRNMSHQMGKFFVSPLEDAHIPMEALPLCEGLITKTIITKEAKRDIRNSYKFNESFIYSHLAGKALSGEPSV